MQGFYRFMLQWVSLLVIYAAGCEGSAPSGVPSQEPGAIDSSPSGLPSAGQGASSSGSSAPSSGALARQMPMMSPDNSAAVGAPTPSTPDDTSVAPGSMPGVSSGNAMATDEPNGDRGPADVVKDLSEKVIAMWGSSVCDGFGVPSGTGWPWLVEKRFAEIDGPSVLHASTSGHDTNSKESSLERRKIETADFVVVCLSLGNQGLGSAATDASAQTVANSYVDDIFTDSNETEGDPVSMVHYIQALGAHPIVTLAYPMAAYTSLHCQHVVKTNILQQSLGVATVNLLGPTNAGNDFGTSDCTWANGRNAPVNTQSDARHPNQVGHEESFYAFPPDLPFALASGIPFPVRPATTSDPLTLGHDASTGQADSSSAEPVRYTPEHAMHGYTLQFAFQAKSDGTLAAIALNTGGFLTLALDGGAIHLIGDDGADVIRGAEPVSNDAWHDLAVTYSHVRQRLALYIDGGLVGEHDVRNGRAVRELFPRAFILGGPAASGRAPAPSALQLRDLFVNRTSLHALEIAERAATAWIGAGSLDVYAPLRASAPEQNRAQTLQVLHVQL